MIKRLPVLYKTKDNLFNEVDIKKPSGAVISETYEAANKNVYLAMRTFVAGCTEKIIGSAEITDPVAIKRAYDLMSTKNLEYISQEIMVLYYDGEDYIEGVYPCPRCGEKFVAQKEIIDDIEIDNRDRIKDLPVNFMESKEELFINIELTNPVTIPTETGAEEIYSFEIGFPSVEDTVKAYSSVGDKNETKLQYAIYANAIKSVNGQTPDNINSWIRTFGLKLFNGITEVKKDIGKISDHINSYGVNPRLEKVCKECGKVWQPFINTPNFFDSALQ